MNIQFRKAMKTDETMLLKWLGEPHVKKFWDNSFEHHNNMLNFLRGRKELFDYWVGEERGGDFPYCLFLTSDAQEKTPQHLVPYLASKGDTWTIDYAIGDVRYLGRGLGVLSLVSFCKFLVGLNPALKTLIIDPAEENSHAVHIYNKAGFRKVGGYTPNEGFFESIPHVVMTLSPSELAP